MSFTIESARHIFPKTLAADVVPATLARFNQLSVEDKLALIWFAYLEMGKTLSISTPEPVNLQFVSSKCLGENIASRLNSKGHSFRLRD